MIEGATTPGKKPSVRAWAIGKGLDVRMIDRLANGKHAVTIDSLDKIAEACGLQAWQLLLDGFDPSQPPDAPITEEDRALLNRLKNLLSR